jgi:hypothetical protein
MWQWTAKLGEFGEGTLPKHEFSEQASTLYATMIKQSYLLVSNDVKELEALAEHLRSPKVETRVSALFPDWPELIQHDMCGYRRFHHDNSIDPMAAGTQDLPLGAESLTFALDAGRKTVVLRLSSNAQITEPAVAKLSSRYQLPVLSRTAGNIWESTMSLSDDQSSFNRTFFLSVLFGFGVYS